MKKSKFFAVVLGALAAFSLISCGEKTPTEDPITQTETQKFTVTFNSNGGSQVGAVEVEEGGKVTKPANPTKEGYEFVGWYKNVECTEEWKFNSDVVNASINLYAKWEEIEVSYKATLVYNNGQENGVIEAVLDGDSYYIDAPSDVPVKDYMEFDFWASDSEGNNKFDFAKPITSDITLYAIYKQAYDSVNTIFNFAEAASTIVANPSGNVSITEETTFGRFTIGAGARFEINGSTDCINNQGKVIYFTLGGSGDTNGITISGKGASGSGDWLRITNEDTGEVVKEWTGLTNSVEFSGSVNNLPSGNYSITSYKSVRIYSLSLTEKLPQGPTSGIEINTSAITTDFLLGRPFDYTGLVVSLAYENGRKDTIELDNIALNIQVEDFTTAGVKKVTVSYQQDANTVYSAEYNVNVCEVVDLIIYDYVLNGSRVTQNRQEVYAVGSTFALTNVAVKAKCLVPGTTDQYIEFVLSANEYSVAELDLSTAGQKTVTISYAANNSISNEYKIEVVEVPALTSDVVVSVNPEAAAGVGEAIVFNSVNQALQFLALCNLGEDVVKTINVLGGHTYHEKVEVNIPNVVIKSVDASGNDVTEQKDFAVIEFNGLAGNLDPSETQVHSTDGSATISIRSGAHNFVARNISFVNYYNTHARYEESKKVTVDTQAVATLVQADKASFINVFFSSYQDTLYSQVGRHYYEDCVIEGRTDYIFGYDATAYFKNCEIRSIFGNSVNNGGYVVATKGNVSGDNNIKYGYIFDGCEFTAEETVSAGSVSIARGWDKGMAIMVMNSVLGAHISKEAYGYVTPDNPDTEGTEPNMNDRYGKMNAEPNPAYLLEYNNTGEGAIAESIEATCTVVDAAVAADYANLVKVFGYNNVTVTYADNWAGPSIGKDVVVTLMDGSTEIGKVYEYSGNKLMEAHLEAPEKDIKFVGWYQDAKLTQAYDFDTVLTANQELVLYAKYDVVAMDEYHLVVPSDNVTYTEDTALDEDGIFFATNKAKVESCKIEGATIGGVECAKQFSLTGGKVQINDGVVSNGIKLVLPKDAEITLYAAQKADKTTTLKILAEDGSEYVPESIKVNGEAVTEWPVLSISAVEEYKFALPAGTYYLGGAGGGAYVYGATVAIEAEPTTKTITYSEVLGTVDGWTVTMASAGSSKIGIEAGITHNSSDANYDAEKVVSCDKLAVGDSLVSPVFDATKDAQVKILCGTTSTSNSVNVLVEALDANGNVVASVTAAGPSGKVAGYAAYNGESDIMLSSENQDIVQIRISCTTDGKNICVVSCDITYGEFAPVKEEVKTPVASYDEVLGAVDGWTVTMASAGSSKIGIEAGITHNSSDANYDAEKVVSCDKLAVGDSLVSAAFEAQSSVSLEILCGTTSTSNSVNVLVEALDANGNVVASVTAAGPSGKVAGYATVDGSKDIVLSGEGIVSIRISCTTDGKNICVVSCYVYA